MKGLSSVLGGVILALLALSSIAALLSTAKTAIEGVRGEVERYSLEAIQRVYENAVRGKKVDEGVVLRELRWEEVKRLIVVGNDGRILVTKPLPTDDGKVMVPNELLSSARVVLLETVDSVMIDVSKLREAESTPIKNESEGELRSGLLAALLARVLNSTDVFNLMEAFPVLEGPYVLSRALPVEVVFKVSDAKYILELTSEGCPIGYSRVAYWGARANYTVIVKLGDRTIYNDSGLLMFTYTLPGTFYSTKSVPRLMANATLDSDPALTISLSVEGYVRVSASSPTPMTCATSFSYSSPSANLWASLQIELTLPANANVVSVVPEVPKLWTALPSRSSELKGLSGYYATDGTLYAYYRGTTVMRAYSSVTASETLSCEISSIGPRFKVLYAILKE